MSTIAYRGASRLLDAVHALRPTTLLGGYRALWLRHHSRAALARMDDHLLADVGLSREQARSEASKPFWAD